MPRIIHTGDIHFDTPFTSRLNRKDAELRRSEIKATFGKIISKANDADLLLIAGDLFDGGTVSADTINFLKRKFSEIPNTRIFISAGNHDPYTPNSIYESVDFGKNVHVFGTELEYVDIAELKTRVHGISFKTEHCGAMFKKFETADDMVNILLIHGDVSPILENSQYNPITKAELSASKMDYVALGHIHKYSGIQMAENVAWAYCGIPEGRGFDEDGGRGIIEGNIEKSNVNLEFFEICHRRYFNLEVDISEAKDELHISEIIKESMKKVGSVNDLYKIILKGEIDQDLTIDNDFITKNLSNDAFFVEISDCTESSYNYMEVASENSLQGRFVNSMLDTIAKLDGDEKEIAKMALEYGVKAMK
ncbi:MAG: DNA repair exonuclease [Oscillospiraceae bacterium]